MPAVHEDVAVLDLMAAPLATQIDTLAAWGLPRAGLLILMSPCHGRCFFCASPAVTDPPPSDWTPWERAASWLEGNRHLGVEDLCLGGTEPTTHPRFLHTLRLAREVGFRRVQLMTSGVELAKHAASWRQQGIASVCVPLYPDHDAVVGVPGHRQRVVAGLDAAHAVGIEVHVHSLALRRTRTGLTALAEEVSQRWDTTLAIAPVRPKEGVFDWAAEVGTLEGVRGVQLMGFPDCVRPDLPRGGPLLTRLYFLGQARHHPPVCAPCTHRSRCPGVLVADPGRDLVPFTG